MTRRYGRARLITRDDRRYQDYLEQFRIARSYQRAMRPPSARQVFGEEVEELLRAWLARSRPLSDRRYLEYEERRGGQWVLKYRELDALEIRGRDTVHVYEIKASRSPKSLRRGLRQLEENRKILSLLFPHIAGTLLFLDTGMMAEERETVLARLERVVFLGDLSEVVDLGDRTGLFWVDLEWIIELAGGEQNLTLDWMDEEETVPTDVSLEEQEPRIWTSGADEQDVGALGQALLKALRRQGESAEGKS
jgi:hypothetical protein